MNFPVCSQVQCLKFCRLYRERTLLSLVLDPPSNDVIITLIDCFFALQILPIQRLTTWGGGWMGEQNYPISNPFFRWTFAASSLYALTVITSTGYDHLTPSTDAGRIFTVFYGLLGIPLMFITVFFA